MRSRGARPRAAAASLRLLLALAAAAAAAVRPAGGACVDVVAGGGGGADAAAAAVATTGTAFPFTALAARPNSSDVAVAGIGAVYLRLAASGDLVRVAGTATSTLQALTSVDAGASGQPGALTPLCGSVNCIGGLSFSPRDGSLVLISGGYVRALGPDGLLRVVAGVGFGSPGTAGDGGPATAAQFLTPSFTAVSPADGSVFVSDYSASTVRRVGPGGVISLFAGTPGVAGDSGDGGQATSARLKLPLGLAFAPGGGALFIADGGALRVRRVDVASGLISTFAGTGASPTAVGVGDGGPAVLARLGFPISLAVDPVAGALYIAEVDANVVRRVRLADGVIDTVVGNGGPVSSTSTCTQDTAVCPATSVSIARPKHLTVDIAGNLFVLLESQVVVHIVRFATRSASAAGSIIVFDAVLQGAQVTAVEADALNAVLQGSGSVEELSDGSVIVIEYQGQRVRRLMPDGSLVLLAGGAARTAAGAFVDGSPLSALALRSPFGVVAIPPGSAFGRTWPALSFALSDEGANMVYGVAGATPSAPVYRLAGAADRSSGAAGDGGAARDATLSQPRGLESDVDGGLIVVDSGNLRLRKISPGAAPAIATIAGGGSSVSDGVPATSAAFSIYLYKACRNNAGLIFIPDFGSCVLYAVDPATGLVAFVPGAANSSGCAFACSRDSDGGLLILDALNARVRKMSSGPPSSAAFSTLVSASGLPLPGDTVAPLQASRLTFPSDARRSLASGDLLIGDFGAGLVLRMLAGARSLPCPAGYSCACIAAAPCSDPSSFCPQGSTAPLPVSAGYRAVAVTIASAQPSGPQSPSAAAGPASPLSVFVTQEVCPVGYYCPGSATAAACPPGTYGSGTAEVSAAACSPCPPGTYFSGEAGAAQLDLAAAAVSLPCRLCPRGTFAAGAGAALCFPCQPGTTTLMPGAQSPGQCIACSPSNVSLYGGSCVRAADDGGADVLIVDGQRLQLQRLVDVNSIAGDLDGPTQYSLVLKLSEFAAAVGLVIALLALLYPTLPRRTAAFLAPALHSLDLVSSKSSRVLKRLAAAGGKTSRRIMIAGAVLQRRSRQQGEDGEQDDDASGLSGGEQGDGDEHESVSAAEEGPPPQHKAHSRLGVVVSAAVIVAIASVAFASCTQFFAVNTDVSSALQPSNPGDIASFADALSPFALAAEPAPASGGAATDASLAQALGGLSSGLLVSVRASGARCALVSGVAFDLSRGAFEHAVTQDAGSGEASHSFSCADCVPHDLSTLRFALPRECEGSAVLTVSAVGAWGSVTATSHLVGGGALGGSVSLTVPVTFEALQDLSWSEYASALAQSGVQTAGGKSARGLAVGAALDLVQAPPPPGADAAAVAFVLSLPLQPTFVLATLTLHTSWSGFISSLVGLAGFVPVGGFAYVVIEALFALALAARCGGSARNSARVAPP